MKILKNTFQNNHFKTFSLGNNYNKYFLNKLILPIYSLTSGNLNIIRNQLIESTHFPLQINLCHKKLFFLIYKKKSFLNSLYLSTNVSASSPLISYLLLFMKE